MQEQPIQPILRRFFGTFRKLFTGNPGSPVFAPALLLAGPWQHVGSATIPIGSESSLTLILAVMAGALGVSASLLYRHMHQRELELRTRAENAEAELRALLMMTDEAVLVIAEDGTLRATNPAAEELFDRSAEDFLGEHLTEVIAQPLCLPELTKHGPVDFSTTARRGEDQYSQVEMLLSPVELSGRASYLAIVRQTRATMPDDTSGSARRRADLSKSVEKFTHDLNNQLTSVLGNLSLILMAPSGEPANQGRLLQAKKTALRAQALSQKLQILVQDDVEGGAEGPETATKDRTIVPMPNIKTAPQVSEPPAPSRASRILILDDEEAICDLVANVLDSSGFEVTEATTVPAALKACEEAKDSGEPFALVICDLSLPGGMNGIQAAERLREIDPGIKSIVSSGYDGDPIMRDCRKYGFMAAIAKPYDLSKLLRTVGQVLSGNDPEIRKSA
jgi:CheY-like chemotaxis protein